MFNIINIDKKDKKYDWSQISTRYVKPDWADHFDSLLMVCCYNNHFTVAVLDRLLTPEPRITYFDSLRDYYIVHITKQLENFVIRFNGELAPN